MPDNRHSFSGPIAAGAAAALLLGALPANAQDSKEDSEYIAGLKACQTIADDTERLSCYDNAVGTVVTAADEGTVRIVDKEQVKKTKRGLFGLNIGGLFGDDEGDELDLLETTVTAVSVSGNTVIITVEEGDAVWRIKNAKSRIKRTKPGDTVVFKKASLGSYFVRINGKTGVRGSRIR